MKCLGRNMEQHCCWLEGEVCPHLEENTEPGFRWTCGLRRELGSWDAVLADDRYIARVQPKLDEIMDAHPDRPRTLNCRDYPDESWGCGQCYPVGD